MSNLVGWWPLHEQKGTTANDLSGNGNHGTLNGGITQGTAGKMGQTAYSFDGTDDQLSLPNSSKYQFQSQDDFTISSWIKVVDDGSYRYFQFYGNNGGSADGFEGWRFQVNSGDKLIFQLTDSSSTQLRLDTSSGFINPNKWYHVAITHESNGIARMYANNQILEEQKTVSLSTIDYSPLEHFISGRPDGNNLHNGEITDARIYNRALTPQEIQKLYQWGNQDYTQPKYHNGNDNGAISRWNFNSNADDSWGTNHGTLNGNATTGATPTIRNGSLSLDGSGDYVEVTDDSSLKPTDFTVSAWFNTNDITSTQGIVDKMDEGTEGYRVMKFSESNGLGFHIMDSGNTTIIKTTEFAAGNWYNAVMTYDNSQNKLSGYLNGTKIGEKTGNITHTNENMIIGGRLKDGTYDLSFNGKIDDLRIYNRALKPYEVFQLYQWGTRGRDMRKLTVNAKR